MIVLERIHVHPIKSLDPVELREARVLPSGALEFDRRWALVDSLGDCVTAKRTAQIQRVRAQFDLERLAVTLALPGTAPETFSLVERPERIAARVGGFLGLDLTLRENAAAGIPDDLDAPGPTVLSRETLEEVSRWFPGVPVNEMRLRLRANLELAGGGAFWEDRLYGALGDRVVFHIGEVELAGTNPCARCAVPSRDSQTGQATGGFAAEFERRRRQTLPSWADRTRFDHAYRAAVNTVPTGAAGGILRVGDAVELGAFD